MEIEQNMFDSFNFFCNRSLNNNNFFQSTSAALSSLNSFSGSGKVDAGQVLIDGVWADVDMSTLPVDKFFGIACPSTLNNDTLFTDLVRYGTNETMDLINKTHVEMGDYVTGLFESKLNLGTPIPYLTVKTGDLFVEMFANAASEPISNNLMYFYDNLARNDNSLIDFSNVEVDLLKLYNGYDSDLILHYQDGIDLRNSLSRISNKELIKSDYWTKADNHMGIKSNVKITSKIKEVLND